MSGWPDWPWSLLDLVPEAAAAAWAVPAVIVWHFDLADPPTGHGTASSAATP